MYPEVIIQKLNEIAPPELAEPFDEGKIGLIIEGRREPVKIATALDATLHVVKEAVLHDIDMLIVHHTPIWYPITHITGFYADLLSEVLCSGMHVFVMHTNYDYAPSGVNECLSGLLSLSNTMTMSLGVVGDISLTCDEIAFRLGAPLIVYNGDMYSKMELRLGVVGGSGFDPVLIEEARSLGASAFLSSELKHSVMRQFSEMILLESTHYALEAPAMMMLAQRNDWLYIEDVPKISIAR